MYVLSDYYNLGFYWTCSNALVKRGCYLCHVYPSICWLTHSTYV